MREDGEKVESKNMQKEREQGVLKENGGGGGRNVFEVMVSEYYVWKLYVVE